ncbi:MAG: hypothetical protein EOO00_03200 [Chitinophagaceae bacterium]|nr:MAG: hypothetical protein EOO00_03200 [Chitinophagaceae bacterium]
MELDDLKSAWHTYDAKVQKALNLNVRFLEMVQTQKVKSKLTPLYWGKLFETAAHGIVMALLVAFLVNNVSDIRYFASGILLLAFYGVALSNSAKQMKIIKRIDYAADVVSIQKNLATLQADTLNYSRLTILCIPTFLAYPPVVSKAIKDLNLTYFADFDIIAQSGGSWWLAQFVSSVVLIPLCVWMYTQLTSRNIHKPWVKDFIEKASGRRVRDAVEFVRELDELK